MESFILMRTKDGTEQMLKTVGRQFNDGVWCDWDQAPHGCSFSLPVIFDTLHAAGVRCDAEEKLEPSWSYEIRHYE